MNKLKDNGCTAQILLGPQADSMCQQVALDGPCAIIYRMFNQQANQLAYWLQRQDIEADQCAILLLPAHSEFIIYILAIVNTDAVYFPLDITLLHTLIEEISWGGQPYTSTIRKQKYDLATYY